MPKISLGSVVVVNCLNPFEAHGQKQCFISVTVIRVFGNSTDHLTGRDIYSRKSNKT